MKNFNGLVVVNIELTSRCNKSCWMCGRRKLEQLGQTNWGDIEFSLLQKIEKQLPHNIIIQFHNNGEPLIYPCIGSAISLFKNQIKCLNTNAKLLVAKADAIIDNLDTLTISVIENDPESDEQYEIVKKFLEIKGDRKPYMVYRLLGNVSKGSLKGDNATEMIHSFIEKKERWYKLPGLVCTRILHNPMGSYNYERKVTIPEHGICLDLLSHLVIDRYGDVYPCVRFNPNKHNLLGNIKNQKLVDMWNSLIRQNLIKEHIKGNRNCSELCSKCHYYGCPTGQ